MQQPQISDVLDDQTAGDLWDDVAVMEVGDARSVSLSACISRFDMNVSAVTFQFCESEQEGGLVVQPEQ